MFFSRPTKGGGTPGGGMVIGDPVIGATPNLFLYVDNAGDLYQDSLAERDSVNLETKIKRNYQSTQNVTEVELNSFGTKETPVLGTFTIGETVEFYEVFVSAPIFSGIGLDDMGVNSYEGYQTSVTYTITIDSVGSPDTFSWTDGTNSGSNIPIPSGSNSVLIGDGLYIYFNSDTGHTLGDSWTVNITSALYDTGTLVDETLYMELYDGLSTTSPSSLTAIGVTSSARVVLDALYPVSSFSIGEIVYSFDLSINAVNGTGEITNIVGNVYTISSSVGFVVGDAVLDVDPTISGQPTKFAGISVSNTIPVTTDIESGFVAFDDVGQTISGSGILSDFNSDKLFAGNADATSVGGVSSQFGIISTIGSIDSKYFFPLQDGIAGQAIVTNGNGLLSWGTLGLKWYAENATAPSTAPVATGTGSIALGDGAEALTKDMFVYGQGAGQGATNADNANFIGVEAGLSAINANHSNFLGSNAGLDATDAYSSNFLGSNAGNGATNANNSNFFGELAGNNAANASNSNFIGSNAGYGATDAYYANFLGLYAGYKATNASNSNFIGDNAGNQATDAYSSNFLGYQAGQSATNASNSNFLGSNAGYQATNAYHSNFFGGKSGSNADNANYSNFLGSNAGNGATNANNSNFIGDNAGYQATNASNSNFIGRGAGQNAINATNSNFFGGKSGSNADNANYSNFLGDNAGFGATNANNSLFIGQNAGAYNIGGSGLGTPNANNSIFIGNNAGYTLADNALNNSLGGTSILIGDDTSTGGFSNSIALGKGATNTATNQLMIGSVGTSPIDNICWQGILNSSDMHNNALPQGDATQQQVRSGTYTPTLTNVTNISASTAYKFQWMRVGNVVTVSGQVDITNTTIGASELGISLPITSNLTLATDCVGSAPGGSSGILDDVGWVSGDTTNDRASMQSTATGTASHSHWVSFTYEIIN